MLEQIKIKEVVKGMIASGELSFDLGVKVDETLEDKDLITLSLSIKDEDGETLQSTSLFWEKKIEF